MTFLRNLWNDEQGQDLIEYTLLMAFVLSCRRDKRGFVHAPNLGPQRGAN